MSQLFPVPVKLSLETLRCVLTHTAQQIFESAGSCFAGHQMSHLTCLSKPSIPLGAQCVDAADGPAH